MPTDFSDTLIELLKLIMKDFYPAPMLTTKNAGYGSSMSDLMCIGSVDDAVLKHTIVYLFDFNKNVEIMLYIRLAHKNYKKLNITIGDSKKAVIQHFF